MFTLIVLSLFALAAGNNFTCEECLSLVSKSEDFLSLFDTYAMYECSLSHEVGACKELVQTVFPYITAQIIDKYTPDIICQKIDYCPRKWKFWWQGTNK
jgi:hypothetical protein